AALEGALHGGQHEQRHGVVREDQSSRPEDVAAVGNEEHAATSEEVRENSGGNDGQTVSNPVDGGELRDEERVVPGGEYVEIEQKPPDAHRKAAERSAQQEESRVPAETAHAPQVVAAAARLPEQKEGDDDRERDAKEPDNAGDLGTLVRSVGVPDIAPGQRGREDTRGEHEDTCEGGGSHQMRCARA